MTWLSAHNLPRKSLHFHHGYRLAAWLNYDTQFRTLVASDPFYTGIPVTQTCDYSALQTLPLLFTCHVHTVGLQITTPWEFSFLSSHCTVYLHSPMSQDLPPQALPVGSSSSLALITQSVTAQIPHSPTDVNSLVPTTVLSTAPTETVLVNTPKPWTPI